MRFTLLLFVLILFCIPISSFGQKHDDVFTIAVFCDSTNDAGLAGAKEILKHKYHLFQLSDSFIGSFHPKFTYWLYLEPSPQFQKQEYVLSFENWVSHIEVYPYPFENMSGSAGRMVSGISKDLAGCNVLLPTDGGSFLIKVQNKVWTESSMSSIKIISYPDYQLAKSRNNLFQGIIVGCCILMLVFNLFIFFFSKKLLHFYYILFVLLNTLFILFTFGYSDKYIFTGDYRLNFIFLTFQLIAAIFYLLFVREAFLKHCSTYPARFDRKIVLPFIYTMLVINILTGALVYIRMDIFSLASNISNLLNTFAIMALFIYFFKGFDWFLKLIFAGTVLLVFFGWINVMYVPLGLPAENKFYELGVTLEMLIFSFAINRQHFIDIKQKYRAEFRKQEVASSIRNKDLELNTKKLLLTAKDETLGKFKEHLGNAENKDMVTRLTQLLLDAGENNDIDPWNEFELYFNDAYPNFYKSLSTLYPDLTKNEVRLCAFLRLNLNTKEIASITKKSAKSIEIMRSRIRKKMGLERDDSLNHALLIIENN